MERRYGRMRFSLPAVLVAMGIGIALILPYFFKFILLGHTDPIGYLAVPFGMCFTVGFVLLFLSVLIVLDMLLD